jgi:hypothetical protein
MPWTHVPPGQAALPVASPVFAAFPPQAPMSNTVTNVIRNLVNISWSPLVRVIRSKQALRYGSGPQFSASGEHAGS